jgi:hypothetical protein
MSENQPDPSGPQWTSAWEYQAGAAKTVLEREGRMPQPSQPPRRRPSRRKRWRAAIIVLVFAFVFLIGGIYDVARHQNYGGVPSLVLAGICAVLGSWLAVRAQHTEQT